MAVVTVAAPRFPEVARIVVLRGGGLGDLLVAMPAIEAIAAAYPGAEVVLLASPVHAELLRERPSPVSRVEVLPVAEGIRDGDGAGDAGDVESFRARLGRHGSFDLGVQLHGGGRFSNPFLRALGPRHTVGTATDDAEPLDRTIPYVYYQHEVMRWLEVAALAGAVPTTLEPRIHLTGADVDAVTRHVPRDGAPLAVVHPGASDPRRRWPAERFAQVVAALLDDGADVRIVGDAGDAALAHEVAERALIARGGSGNVDDPADGRAGEGTAAGDGARVAVLAGRLGIGESAALLAAADVVVANDSGPRHLAQAVGAPTVGVFWFGNVVNAAPFSRARHRVHLSFTVACPVCGVDVTQVGWTAPRCEHDVSFVADVPVAPVLADVRQLMATRVRGPGTRAAPGSRTPRAG